MLDAVHSLLLQRAGEQSLQANVGDIVLVSGAVGVGKTYFLKQLAGLLPFPELSKKQISSAAMLFDIQPPLWMGQFVEEELTHGIYPRVSHDRMRAALDDWNLHDVGVQDCLSSLNRLQSLRVHLVAMGLSRHRLWLLDNPTACLPVTDGKQLRLDMCRWAKKHDCIILVACNRWQDWQGHCTQHWHIRQQGTWPYLEQK